MLSAPQDLLTIDVWHEPELSQSVPVRPDGKISLPLVGDMEVSGLTPRTLQARPGQGTGCLHPQTAGHGNRPGSQQP